MTRILLILIASFCGFTFNTAFAIFKGNPTSAGEFPEFVQLWEDNKNGEIYAMCGGTLISTNKVLTAAHCVEDLKNTPELLFHNTHFS